MATILQKRLARNIIKNAKRAKPLNKQQLVVSSGYNEITADRHSHEIMAQKGVQEELHNLGFHEDGAKKVVSEIMYNKEIDPNPRLKAAEMVFKVSGSFAPEKHLHVAFSLVELENLQLEGVQNSDELLPDAI